MKLLLRLSTLAISLLMALSAVSCNKSPSETTAGETTESTTETTSAETTESTTLSQTPTQPSPDLLLREGDTVTEVIQIDSVRLLGGDDKRYTVRIALLDVEGSEVSGKGCYFDAVDPETGTVIAHKRLLGASTVSYYKDSTYHTIAISATGMSFDPERAVFSLASELYDFSCISEIGLPIEPQFHGLSEGEGFSLAEMENTERVLSWLNARLLPFLPAMSNKLYEEMDDFTYLMSNDIAFLTHCGEQTPTVNLLFEFWEQIRDLSDLMKHYTLW